MCKNLEKEQENFVFLLTGIGILKRDERHKMEHNLGFIKIDLTKNLMNFHC